MAFIYDLTDTWNNAGISFNGIKLNATDTASAAGSKLLDLQIGGASKFTVNKTGSVIATGNIHSTSGGFTFPDGTTQITRAVTNVTATDGSIAITGTTDINLSVVSAPKAYAVTTTVRNNSGATLTKGTAVYINGAVGQNPTVTKAIASGDATSAQTLGLIANDISNNATGEVILIGTLYNVNTSAYTDGQQLYLSPTTAGTLTATKPYAPSHLVYMAVVEHSHPSQGKLFVKVQNGYELDELHNVSAQTPSNNHGIFYNTATSLWENKSIVTALGYTPYNATNPAGYTTNVGTVTSVAALTLGTSGTDLSSSIANGTTTPVITLNVPTASAANRGALSSSDWSTFNAKQAALVSGTNIKTVGGASLLGSGDVGTIGLAYGGTGATTASGARTALGLGTAAVLNAGVSGGVATLDGSGTVPTSQLPGAVLGGLNYQGTWNASTNTPTLASSTGSKGYYYVVSVAGSTNLNGITDWKIGDWAVYDGSAWQKVDNTDAVSSVNGFTGAVVLTTSDVAQGTNLYFTQAAARGSVSAGTGISYNSTSGVITNSAPDQTVALTGAGTTTVTGTYPNFTITSNDSTVGTVTSVAVSGGTTGLTTSGGPITSSGTITLAGTLGVANGGTGATSLTSGYLVKGNGTAAASASVVFDNGTNVGIGTASPAYKLQVDGTIRANGGDVQAYLGALSTYGVAGTAAVKLFQNSGNWEINNPSGYLQFYNATAAAERMRVTANGDVLVNTTTSLYGYANNPSIELNGVDGSTIGLKKGNVAGSYISHSTNLNIFNTTANGIVLATNNTERMRITAGGDVGIGTSSPAAKLDVSAGNIFLTQDYELQWKSGATTRAAVRGTSADTLNFYTRIGGTITETMRVTATGNVGIGTTAPAQKLSVAGTIESTTGGVIVPDQLAYDYATSNLPTTRPALSLDFVDVGALDPRVTFTRSSTATFYDGKTQSLAEQNLLLQSQTFDNAAWIKFNSSATANTTSAPDQTGTADTITENTATGQHGVYQANTVVSGSTYTWSGYVKNNGRSIVQFQLQATANVYFVEFDLTAVTTTNRSGTGTATITAAGNGWYRITATATATGSGTGYWQLNLCSAANTASYTGDGTSGIFIWGAQIEQRATATAYTPTTTTAITRYQPTLVTAAINAPRFDYDPVTLAAKGLLIEEQRTNIMLQSETFDSGTWSKGNATITANATVSPDGAANADALVEDAATSAHFCQQFVSFTTATAYTFSTYVKAGTRAWCLLQFPTSAFGASTGSFFNLSGAGALGAAVGSPTARTITAVGNGWYRVTITATSTATAGGNVPISAASADNTNSYTGVAGAEALYLYGAQLEAGAFATSYIPTVASQVTRSADIAQMTGTNFSSWYNQSEGTFVFEGSPLAPATLAQTNNALAATDGTNNNLHRIGRFSNFWFTDTRSGNVTQATFSPPSTYTSNTTAKVASAYKTDDFAASVNGATALTDTSGTVPTVINRLLIGAPALELNGHIRQIAYYNTRLPNAVLQGITS